MNTSFLACSFFWSELGDICTTYILLCLELLQAGIKMREFVCRFSVTFAFADETVSLLPIAGLLPSLSRALGIFCLIWHFHWVSFTASSGCLQGRRDRKEKEEEWPDLNFLASRVRRELSSCASIPWLIPNAASRQRARRRWQRVWGKAEQGGNNKRHKIN